MKRTTIPVRFIYYHSGSHRIASGVGQTSRVTDKS
jgi:hypothetical protein